MLKRLKSIHPGWFIGGFFVVLIAFNVVFFAIAASTPVDLLPRNAPKKSAVLEAPAQPGEDTLGAEVTAPSSASGADARR